GRPDPRIPPRRLRGRAGRQAARAAARDREAGLRSGLPGRCAAGGGARRIPLGHRGGLEPDRRAAHRRGARRHRPGRRGGEGLMAAACIRIDERTRAEARRARREWDWGAERRSAAFLLPSLAERALRAAGYRPAPQGAWVGPDGEHFEDLELAVLTEFTAAALAEAEPSPDPIEEALRQ